MNRRKSVWVILFALIAGFLWAGGSVRAVSAHALLVHSLPEANAVLSKAPSAIDLWFTEALEPGFSGVRLFDSSGREIIGGTVSMDGSDDTHMTLPLDPLDPGIYTVAWQSLSKADGHEFSGSFPFTVLNPDRSRPSTGQAAVGIAAQENLPSPGEWLARWLLLLGSAILFGISISQLVIMPIKASDTFHETVPQFVELHNLTVISIWVAILAFTAGQWLHVALQVNDLGGFSRLADFLMGTRAGALVLARQTVSLSILLVALNLPQPEYIKHHKRVVTMGVVGSIVALIFLLASLVIHGDYLLGLSPIFIAIIGLILIARFRGEISANNRRKMWLLLVVLSGVLLLYIAVASHASAGQGKIWAILVDYVHLMAAGTWVGGLLFVAVLLWRGSRLPEQNRVNGQRLIWPVVRRFSYLASFCVFVLFLTGVFNSLVQLPGIFSLWQTTYGRVLMAKVGLIFLAMGMAFLNNQLVHNNEIRSKSPWNFNHLGAQVKIEVGIVLLLMLSVAVLVQTPTPRDAALVSSAQQPALPFNTVVAVDDLSLHVQVTPNQVGNDRFWVHVYHPDGSGVGEIQLLQLQFAYRDMTLGQSKVNLEPLGGEAYQIEGSYLSQAGTWDISAYIRRRDMDDSLAKFSLVVPRPSSGITVLNPWQNPIPSIPPVLLGLCLLLALAVVPIVWREPLQQAFHWYKFSWRTVIAIAYAFAVVSIVLLIAFGQPLFNSTKTNNQSKTTISLEQGKAIYEVQCISCHGSTGLGDGPAAAGLNPPPANLQVHLAGGAHSDEQIFKWISNGISNSAMPPFSDVLSEDERWQVIAYIRSLAPQP